MEGRSPFKLPPVNDGLEGIYTMKEKSRKISPDTRELQPFKKKGICIYIKDEFIIAEILKSLFETIGEEKKLSKEEDTLIMKEVASYIYFETVKQIWEYREGDLPENEARKVLDVVSTYFAHSYHIDNLPEKLEEYRRAENPLLQVSTNIRKIAKGKLNNCIEQWHIAVDIAGAVKYFLFDGIRQVFRLSETEMAEAIEDFFVNYYPKFIEKGE